MVQLRAVCHLSPSPSTCSGPLTSPNTLKKQLDKIRNELKNKSCSQVPLLQISPSPCKNSLSQDLTNLTVYETSFEATQPLSPETQATNRVIDNTHAGLEVTVTFLGKVLHSIKDPTIMTKENQRLPQKTSYFQPLNYRK